MTYETTVMSAFAAMSLLHGWFLIRCAGLNYLQLIPHKIFFPFYCFGVVANYLIFGAWLEWYVMFAFSAAVMIPLSYYNWKKLWEHEGNMRVLAMQAAMDRARAARPVQPERGGRTFRYFDPEPKRLN